MLRGGNSGFRPSGQAPSGLVASRINPGRIAKIGATALRIYTCHILVFTIGATVGAFEAFGILCAMWGPCR